MSLIIRKPSLAHLGNPKEYKLHAAMKNPYWEEPYHALQKSKYEWEKWNRHAPSYDHFNRTFIFSMARNINSANKWTFGGIFIVYNKKWNKDIFATDSVKKRPRPGYMYRIKLCPFWDQYIGNMTIQFNSPRQSYLCLEKHIRKMTII